MTIQEAFAAFRAREFFSIHGYLPGFRPAPAPRLPKVRPVPVPQVRKRDDLPRPVPRPPVVISRNDDMTRKRVRPVEREADRVYRWDHDLSGSVNRACEIWLVARGLDYKTLCAQRDARRKRESERLAGLTQARRVL